jgi:hypothetical protein
MARDAHHRHAVALLEQRHRYFAGPEARQAHGCADLAQPLVDALGQLLRRQRHLELPLETLGEGFGYLHGGSNP